MLAEVISDDESVVSRTCCKSIGGLSSTGLVEPLRLTQLLEEWMDEEISSMAREQASDVWDDNYGMIINTGIIVRNT